jgi:hypothetical protein
MEATLRGACRPEVPDGVRSADAVWGVRGVMDKDILPAGPEECRRRRRLYALRAMDRLGLLGDENLIPTLARRPALRWLADEEGARWGVLTELGRIGEPDAFEEAVEWALENRPRLEEARGLRLPPQVQLHPLSGAERSSLLKATGRKRGADARLPGVPFTEARCSMKR